MTLEDSIQAFRRRALQAAEQSGNASATGRRYDVSRTVCAMPPPFAELSCPRVSTD